MNLQKIKYHLQEHWWKYLGGMLILATVTHGLGLLFGPAMPWVLYPKLDYYQQMQYLTQLSMMPVMSFVYTALFIVGFWWLHYGQGSLANLGKKNVKRDRVNVQWDDVIGMEAAKQEAWEVVQLLKDRALVKRIGGKILKGLLLLGPPGCGKTYLAKAIATEAGVPFLSMSGSEFVEIFVGTGPGRVRKLFKRARRLAKMEGGCIVFIDELDAVAQQRSHDMGFGIRSEQNNTVNALLVEIDGLSTESAENVLVIAATNASEKSLDSALLRPGRLDRKVYVDRPNLADREKIFACYLKRVTTDDTIDPAQLARRAVWKSAADIENIIKESALIAARQKRETITYKDISEAVERIDLGFKVTRTVSETERRETAYHETGHLIVGYFLHPQDDVFKASIASRRETLGVVWTTPREERHSVNRDELMADIKVALGGYASEKIFLGATSVGVSSDFQKAMQVASDMVWRCGMGSNGFIGDYTALLGGWQFQQSSSGGRISERTKERLDDEVHKILTECLTDVETLLQQETELVHRFAKELLARNELEYDEIEAIFAEYGKSRTIMPPSTMDTPTDSSSAAS